MNLHLTYLKSHETIRKQINSIRYRNLENFVDELKAEVIYHGDSVEVAWEGYCNSWDGTLIEHLALVSFISTISTLTDSIKAFKLTILHPLPKILVLNRWAELFNIELKKAMTFQDTFDLLDKSPNLTNSRLIALDKCLSLCQTSNEFDKLKQFGKMLDYSLIVDHNMILASNNIQMLIALMYSNEHLELKSTAVNRWNNICNTKYLESNSLEKLMSLFEICLQGTIIKDLCLKAIIGKTKNIN